jgi:hypothetical protein
MQPVTAWLLMQLPWKLFHKFLVGLPAKWAAFLQAKVALDAVLTECVATFQDKGLALDIVIN